MKKVIMIALLVAVSMNAAFAQNLSSVEKIYWNQLQVLGGASNSNIYAVVNGNVDVDRMSEQSEAAKILTDDLSKAEFFPALESMIQSYSYSDEEGRRIALMRLKAVDQLMQRCALIDCTSN